MKKLLSEIALKLEQYFSVKACYAFSIEGELGFTVSILGLEFNIRVLEKSVGKHEEAPIAPVICVEYWDELLQSMIYEDIELIDLHGEVDEIAMLHLSFLTEKTLNSMAKRYIAELVEEELL